MMDIIGRKEEIRRLREYHASGRPEFVALYGRRRVGKTYLVEQVFGSELAFHVTGVLGGGRSDQETVFLHALRRSGYSGPAFKNWYEAFWILRDQLQARLAEGERCILFIDELPCFDTLRSGFVKAFSDFWNDWCLPRKEIMLIVCGSATTWMIRHIIDSHGGLHNRITHEMHLHPFTLKETEAFLQSKGIDWDRLSIIQLYSVLGGIPYYLGLVERSESASAAVDRLFYGRDAELANEYDRLFKSLYNSPEPYMKIVSLLCRTKTGMTRDEIAKGLGMSGNGHLGEYLDNLVKCDFVRLYLVKDSGGKRLKKNGGLYQMTDFYTVFHHSFMASPTTDPHFWSTHLGSPLLNTWLGLSFERICMAHIEQIKHALHIDTIGTEYFSWRSRDSVLRVQIDLVIERADRVVHICEMKYSEQEYALQKDEDLRIRNRMGVYREEGHTNKTLQAALVTTFGLRPGKYASLFHQVVTMDDLFEI